MKQEITQVIATSAVTLATSTGIISSIVAFFDVYAAGIGAMSSIFFGCIYMIFQWSSNRKLTIAEINKVDIADLSESLSNHVVETREEFNSITSCLERIETKLS